MTPPPKAPAMQDNVEGIVAGLTKAQREAIPFLPDQPKPYLPIEVSRITRERLIKLGLLHSESPASGFGMVRYWLTPLGRAVRARLLSSEGNGRS